MKELPILFNTEMVRAILDGRKTQTRRLVKEVDQDVADLYTGINHRGEHEMNDYNCTPRYAFLCPYGAVGDRLWVRESARVIAVRGGIREIDIEYIADEKRTTVRYPARLAPAPMGKLLSNGTYREASRISLEITNVSVERVQDITEEDAKSEGVGIKDKDGVPYLTYKNSFMSLWDRINFKRGFGWDENPWVWVIEFRVL